MRKRILILLIIVLFLSLIGCNKKPTDQMGRVMRIVTFVKDDKGLMQFYDENFNILFEKETEYPNNIFYDDDAVYISKDGEKYSSIKYVDGKAGKTLTDVKAPIDVLNDESYYSYKDGVLSMYTKDGRETSVQTYVNIMAKNDRYFYYVDSSNILHICDLDSFEELKTEIIPGSDVLTFAHVDGKIYIADDKGYTLIDGDKMGLTYLYPNDFTELNNVNGAMVFMEEMGESVVYTVSFEKYQMILTPVYNEEFYRQIDFDNEFRSYLSDGYEIIGFYELEY